LRTVRVSNTVEASRRNAGRIHELFAVWGIFKTVNDLGTAFPGSFILDNIVSPSTESYA
jgi:hypothetical protein